MTIPSLKVGCATQSADPPQRSKTPGESLKGKNVPTLLYKPACVDTTFPKSRGRLRGPALTTFFGSNRMDILLTWAGSSGGWSGAPGRKSENGKRTCSIMGDQMRDGGAYHNNERRIREKKTRVARG